MLNDVTYSFRALLRAPLFAVVTVSTLAIGIGGATAIFSVVNGVLLSALPYPASARIVTISEADDHSRTMNVSNPNFQDWREQARSFSTLAAYSGGRMTILGGSEPVVSGVYGVSQGFFDVMGVTPSIGRTFTADEARLNGTPAVIVSYPLWRRVLGGRRDLTGSLLRVAGLPATVVGVMPPGFEFPAGAEVWFPSELFPDASGRTAHNLRVVARLRDGVSLAEAQADMSTIARRLKVVNGDDDDALDAAVIPLHERLVGGSRLTLLLLLSAVGLVLAAACLNIATTVIARGADRRRELAIRLALGADRGRLTRLLLTEHVLLALAGGAVGLLVAAWLVRGLVALGPAWLPPVGHVTVDARVVAFALLLSALTPLVFGVLPSIQLTRTDLRDAIAEGGRANPPARTRFRQALVATEVALALVLLVGSGLLVRSFVKVVSVEPGFDPGGVVTMETTVPGDTYPDGPAAAGFYQRLLERIGGLPGVQVAGLINNPPLAGSDANGGFLYEGQSFEEIRGNWQAQAASYRVASSGYFEALRIPVVRGRVFTPADQPGTETVAVINQTMASQYFSGRQAVGERIRFAGMDRDNPWLTIVGIVGDVHQSDLTRAAVPEVYVDYQQLPMRTQYSMTTAVRLEPGLAPDAFVRSARAAVRQLDVDVPTEFSSMDAQVASSVAGRRFLMLVVVSFGGVSLLLAAVGVYGVLAHLVIQRTREIGVRMALGADPSTVTRLVLGNAFGAVGAGALVGLTVALLATRLLRSFLFEVTPTDPGTVLTALAAIAVVTWLAAYGPARRAARVDPLVAMRVE